MDLPDEVIWAAAGAIADGASRCSGGCSNRPCEPDVRDGEIVARAALSTAPVSFLMGLVVEKLDRNRDAYHVETKRLAALVDRRLSEDGA